LGKDDGGRRIRPFTNPAISRLGGTQYVYGLCGLVPLGTYLSAGGLISCVSAAAATFVGVGAIKSRWSPTAWWRSGLETLFIGMSAAAVAFAVAFALKALFQLPAA
jgi:hypothetical protein